MTCELVKLSMFKSNVYFENVLDSLSYRRCSLVRSLLAQLCY